MKIDLCKILGVEDGEEFRFDNSAPKYRVYKNKIQCYWKEWRYSGLKINDIVDGEVIKLPKKKQFSQDTLNFFKMINKKYKWIAKDKSGDIFGFEEKPKKDKYVWLCEEYDYCLDNTCCIDGLNQSLFDQILWEDEEPIRIDDYVER